MTGKETPMETHLETAYNKLKTKLIRFTPLEPRGRTVVTHDHEVDEEGDLVAYLPDDDTNLVFVCRTNARAEVHDDHLLVRNQDGILFKIEFLETKARRRLEARLLL